MDEISSHSPVQPATTDSRLWQWALALLIIAAAAARAWILFSTPLMPGVNGAYYLVQARSYLTHGALGIPDLPLTFCLQASLAWVLHLVTRRDLDTSILLAVKLADSVLPALIALPVFLLARRWGRVAGAPAWMSLVAAAWVTLDAPALSMVGDFEKNSLGLVWLAALLLSIHVWLNDPKPRNAAWVLVFWGLAGLTHIAVFGASLLFGGLAVLFYFLAHRGKTWAVLWPLLLGAGGICVLAAALVLWKFDPHRILRLANALAHPSDFLSGNDMPGFGGPGRLMMPGQMPGVAVLLSSAPSLLFGVVAFAALVVCWRRRKLLHPGEVCVVGACAVGILVMTGPWVQGDKTMRFNLIAVVPAVLAGTFALQHWQWRRLRAGVIVVVSLALIGPSFMRLQRGGQAVISEKSLQELRSLAPLIANPERTLVVARHGVEWWTAWTLHTHIAHSKALETADWKNFEAVFFLRSKSGGFPMMGGGPGGDDRQHMGPRKPGLFGILPRILQPGPPPGGMPPPPPGQGWNPPPDFPAGPQLSRNSDFRPGGNPMVEPEMPADSDRVHDGGSFILARVNSPPDFVSEKAQSR